MGRLLAIDLGKKRSGIAVTDPLKIIASALETVDSINLFSFLQDYFSQEKVEKVIIGMPKDLKNRDTDATALVSNFVVSFTEKFPKKEIVKHDERFTSKMALQAMVLGGAARKHRKEKRNLDKISATIILQSYMEFTQ